MTRLQLVDIELPPDVFAAVMATGIVSIAAHDHRYTWLSDALAAIAGLAFVLLICFSLVKWIVSQRFPFSSLDDPDVTERLLTFVAACAVLGARFQTHALVMWTLATLAWLGWLVLAPLTARGMWSWRWIGLRDRAHGAWELASVATSGLAIVTVHLSLLTVALATWLVAIGIYALMTFLIVWRVIAAPGDDNWQPDSWILMGGLAIATLAGDHIHYAAQSAMDTSLAGAIRAVTLVTWLVATFWIPLLAYTSMRRTRRSGEPLKFAGVWWAMVFPLGMYSAATYAMAIELDWRQLVAVSLAFLWIAFAAWLAVVLSGMLAIRRAQTR